MDKMPPTAALPYRIGNLARDTVTEVPHLRLLPESTTFLSDSVTAACPLKADNVTDVGKDCEEADMVFAEGVLVSDYPDVLKPGIIRDNNVRPVEDLGSPSAVSDSSSVGCTVDDLSPLDADLNSRSSMAIASGVSNYVAGACKSDLGVVCVGMPVAANCKPDLGETTAIEDGASGCHLGRLGRRNSLVSEYVPRWGCVSICGRRQEMEDAATTLLRFTEVPLQMLTSKKASGSSTVDRRSGYQTAHFFGVFDGHGGAQVANYCKERVHGALVEEIGNHVQVEGVSSDNMSKQWHRIFTNCFNKVDAEVAGERRGTSDNVSVGQFEAIAPETVGSTAVVAVVSSSDIIVANCGDSRAVLCRGKQPMPLSVDHKPNREDEYARIEAAGGKVIQWNGYRVLGVLAMSRSIGDRYLKPWVISEPEVMCVPRAREDECLILASDGLWDVLSSEDACDAARKRILLWHKKNGGNSSQGRGGDNPDPAAEAAADYLTKLALHKGSKDNVTVIVIDLKAQRKLKARS